MSAPRRAVGSVSSAVVLALAVSSPFTRVDVSAQVEGQNARQLYNAGMIDAAIAGAEAEYQESGSDRAALVLARAKLDRYRRLEMPDDLDGARRLLDAIDASALGPREAVDWEIGVATSLYFDGRPGPAAVIFERLLDEPLLLGVERDRVLDWWATAVDRIGRAMLSADRQRTYARMMSRLETELRADPASASAAYWSVVAARGMGDPERALDLAVASWTRASLTGAERIRLRIDLDRLVVQGVIPDVAVARTGEGPEDVLAVRTMARLTAEWEELKTFWAGQPGP